MSKYYSVFTNSRNRPNAKPSRENGNRPNPNQGPSNKNKKKQNKSKPSEEQRKKSDNPDFGRLVKVLNKHLATQYHIDNWMDLPQSIKNNIEKLVKSINLPQNIGEESTATAPEANTRLIIERAVKDMAQACLTSTRQSLEADLKKLNKTDCSDAMIIATKFLKNKIHKKLTDERLKSYVHVTETFLGMTDDSAQPAGVSIEVMDTVSLNTEGLQGNKRRAPSTQPPTGGIVNTVTSGEQKDTPNKKRKPSSTQAVTSGEIESSSTTQPVTSGETPSNRLSLSKIYDSICSGSQTVPDIAPQLLEDAVRRLKAQDEKLKNAAEATPRARLMRKLNFTEDEYKRIRTKVFRYECGMGEEPTRREWQIYKLRNNICYVPTDDETDEDSQV